MTLMALLYSRSVELCRATWCRPSSEGDVLLGQLRVLQGGCRRWRSDCRRWPGHRQDASLRADRGAHAHFKARVAALALSKLPEN